MTASYATDPCAKCEEMMQPYLDGALSDAEIALVQARAGRCPAGTTRTDSS